MLSFQLLELAEELTRLDPVRTYPQRGAALVARMAEVKRFRLNLTCGASYSSGASFQDPAVMVSLPLRYKRQAVGTLYLAAGDRPARLAAAELRFVRWGARVFARSLSYTQRLATGGSRQSGEALCAALLRAPLTPRERDVVSLLVCGASTRQIAKRTELTVATVNTYLKRIFAKLGVHSRVELIARMAGTDGPNTDGPGGAARSE